jgi:RNA polymerase sigma factor (sigma-70 family)
VELAAVGFGGVDLEEVGRRCVQAFPFRLGLCIVRPVAALAWTPETEQALVARAKDGDKKALGLLLTRFGPALYRSVLLPRLGNATVAEQALGDTYARVIERIGSFEWQGCGFYPWLRMVALHVAVDLLRARRREVLFGPDDLQREAEASEQDLAAESLTDSMIERRDLDAARTKLEEGLAKIHPRYANAIRWRVIEERPREEVAQALGVSTATFDVVLHRAMTALRKAIAPIDPSAGEP